MSPAPVRVQVILDLAEKKGFKVTPDPGAIEDDALGGGWRLSHADWTAKIYCATRTRPMTGRGTDDQWVVVLRDEEATSASGPEAFHELMLSGWLEDLYE